MVAAQVGGVLDRDGRKGRVERKVEHVDPDDAHATVRSRLQGVLHVVHAGGGRCEGHGGAVGVEGCDGLPTRLLDAHERELRSRRREVVVQRLHDHRLAHEHRREVGRADRVQRAGLLHVDRQRADDRWTVAIGHLELHLLLAEFGGLVRECDEPVGCEPHEVARLGVGADEVEVVAIRVAPIGEHVVRHRLVGLDTDPREARRVRRLVDAVGHHPRRDVGGCGAAASVIHRVVEGDRADEALGRGELECAAAVDRIDGAGRLIDGVICRDHEHVAVWVGVVVEQREDRGATRPDAELVVHRGRRSVDLGALGKGVLERLDGGLLLTDLLGLRLLGRNDVIPVVDQHHVLFHEPDVAVVEIVERDHGAVDAELQHTAFGRLLDVLGCWLLALARQQVALGIRPRAVRAAVLVDRRRHTVVLGAVALEARRNDVDAARSEVHPRERVGGRDDRVPGIETGLLQSQARLFAEVELRAALGDELVRRLVEHHSLLAHRSELELPDRREVLLLGRGGEVGDAVQLLVGARHREDGALARDDGVGILAEFDDRWLGHHVELQVAHRGDRPQLALRRQDREHTAAEADLGACRNVDGRGDLGGCRVHRLDASGIRRRP